MSAAVAAMVLVVEDEPMIGRILEHKLTREGHRVEWVRDGAAAAARLARGDVDLALVDLTLERDGVEVAADAVVAGCGPRVGWLALVEARDHAGRDRALAAGAAGVVVKPFKPTQVAARVAAVLGAGVT